MISDIIISIRNTKGFENSEILHLKPRLNSENKQRLVGNVLLERLIVLKYF